MIPLPDWAKPFLNNRDCPHCSHPTSERGVIGSGIRQRDLNELNPDERSFIMTFEYLCENCGKKSIWLAEPGNNANGLKSIFLAISDAFDNRIIEADKVVPSKISNKEIMELRKFLRSENDFEDFLRFIGMNPDDFGDTDE